MAFEPGQRIGDYQIVAQLGAGGLGVVYEVQHLISQRREAMKILLPNQSGTPEMVERFRREVQTLATLNHPNIAALHTAFYYENQLAMVMEMIDGETLRDRRARIPIPLPEALQYIKQTLLALVYAHALGVVHRDIKPSNIMITRDGLVKLLDFGIAITERSTELTHAGYLLGSLSYMSPEQVSGGKATARSDLYAVGVTLYELLTGRLPITGASDYEIMVGHVQQIPPPVYEVAPYISPALSEAVMRALIKDPQQRYGSADVFLQAIEAAVPTGQVPVAFAPPMPGVRSDSGSGSHPSKAMLPQKPESASGSSGGLQNLPLEEITRRLALYIGPVAKFVIKKIAAQSTDPEYVYQEAARQIASDTDRAAFLRMKH